MDTGQLLRGIVPPHLAVHVSGTASESSLGLAFVALQAEFVIQEHINSNVTGYVIQGVTFSYDVIDNSTGSPDPAYTNFSYYEAWPVVNGQFTGGFDGTDTFRTDSFNTATHGNITISGEMNFYSTSSLSSYTGNNNPANWSPGSSGGVSTSGDLPSTSSAPSWYSSTGGFNHSLYMSWTE
jgi:hypothetical protein